ncbi:hypothetical protein NBZ79_18055 [Sneathiella marina]|uniref:Glycosyltransferase RgtA/B/C/D-like domain-containing protein n=1 Tax=Sneathiella marina TaxID=2950108 RepID=A0ABY4W1I3_9PROT|nr:hypothetical protein [Sneathiella marina]USG61062.1 hypothetical protein NBZ79_18055 [Sneathiella marina]
MLTLERIFLVIALWLVCFIVLPLQMGDSSRNFEPNGPDSYMRLERVNILAETGNWYDNKIERAGAGEGADIHWTRPMDVLIMTLAAPIRPFMSDRAAFELAGIFMPALMSLLLVILVLWAIMPLMQTQNLLLVALLIAAQPALHSYLGIGRIDHHAVLAALMAAVLGCLVRASNPTFSAKFALLAGILTGLGIWISLEFLIVYVPLTIGLGICWLIWGKPWRLANRNFAIGVLGLCAIGLILDTPFSEFLADRYDRLTVAQLFLVACPVLFWTVCAKFLDNTDQLVRRCFGTIAFGVVSFSIIAIFLPDLFIGPMAEADPRINPIWHDKVSEMTPLFISGKLVTLYCLLPMAGIVYGGLILFGRLPSERRQVWVWITLLLICTGALALAHIRASLYLTVVAVFAAGPLIDNLITWVNEKFAGWRKGMSGFFVRGIFIVGPFCLAILVGNITKAFETKEAEASIEGDTEKCDIFDITAFLTDKDFIGGRNNLRFTNNIDRGPELMYRTQHHFLAVPYHRNGDAIFDSYSLLTATEYKVSESLLLKYDIDYILLCPNAAERWYYQEAEDASIFYTRLLSGNLPPELSEVKVPKPWRLFEYKALKQ